MAPVALTNSAPFEPHIVGIQQLKATQVPTPVFAPQATYTPNSYKSHVDITSSVYRDVHSAEPITLDGYTLRPGQIVSAARFGAQVKINQDCAVSKRVANSVAFLKGKLHASIYGVNTGFGGSADTRTELPFQLQISLIEHQLSGVLPPPGRAGFDCGFGTVTDPMSNMMPEAIVRGAILIRVNSLVRGHSAVRMEVLDALLALLDKNLTPIVPLRGSISSSGDLQPLAYCAAAICGHPDIRILDRSSGQLEILTAPAALTKHNINPVTLCPKEGLGLINGTAFSASASVLAAHDAHFLALLGQGVTAMAVEAMIGQAGNFHEFIHKIRPHPGQIESAKNMLKLLDGSRLAVHKEEERNVKDEMGQNDLRQDRYPLRTSPQWLGPQLEDLAAIHSTLACEINSTTDNPLLDIEGDHAHHGGNFQAVAVGQAMEKARLALYMIGKLIFAQMTELINASMNKGLPSCLAGDEPSLNYHCKGLDINMASYTAELGYLANPVTTHVQSAEQHNQAVNSMALVSARYTIEAVETLSMLLSVSVYCTCMAIDLRVMDHLFRQRLADSMPNLIIEHFGNFIPADRIAPIVNAVLTAIYQRIEHTASMDSQYRFVDAFNHAAYVVVDELTNHTNEVSGNPLAAIAAWKNASAEQAVGVYVNTRDEYFSKGGSAAEYMGETRALYNYVRKTLGIKARRGDIKDGGFQSTIGSDVTKIYTSLRSGKMYGILVQMFASS